MFDLGITTCNISDACPLWARYKDSLNSFSDSTLRYYCRFLSVELVRQPGADLADIWWGSQAWPLASNFQVWDLQYIGSARGKSKK
jgi:hypothetical protein